MTWEQPTDYVKDCQQWLRHAGHLVLRVQDVGNDGEGSWFNWIVTIETEGNIREDLRFGEGGARTCAGAKAAASTFTKQLLKVAFEEMWDQTRSDR